MFKDGRKYKEIYIEVQIEIWEVYWFIEGLL